MKAIDFSGHSCSVWLSRKAVWMKEAYKVFPQTGDGAELHGLQLELAAAQEEVDQVRAVDSQVLESLVQSGKCCVRLEATVEHEAVHAEHVL